MRRIFSVFLFACVLVVIVSAQAKKDWSDWSDKDVKKMLDGSAWGQVQTDTGGPDIFSTTAEPTRGRGSNEGLTEGPAAIDYHIRLLSAKPIRAAFMRQKELNLKAKPDDQVIAQWKSFVDRKFDTNIVVSVMYESRSGHYTGPAVKAFAEPKMELLKKNTYLERTDGKRVFLDKYIPPSNDGLGAKFIFPRTVDGKPFVSADSGEVRFISQVPADPATMPSGSTSTSTTGPIAMIKLNMRFKVAMLLYDGQLEY